MQKHYNDGDGPVKIGLVLDKIRHRDEADRIYSMIMDDYIESGRLERNIEFIKVYPYGPPAGSIQTVINAYHDLCDQGCLAVLGFNHADSSIAIGTVADERKVPVVALGATVDGMAEWAFSICWSSIPHDAYTVASWLRRNNYKRVVVTYDRAAHAEEYLIHFRLACARAGIRILADERFPQIQLPELEDIFASAVEDLKSLRPDALAHVGTGRVAGRWAGHVTRSGWGIPRVMNDAFFGASDPALAPSYEGWVGTTMWDPDNEVTNDLMKRYCERYPEIKLTSGERVSLFRDGIAALLEGIILAPTLTPEGVRQGLEMVQLLPAASGGPRTCISFGPYAHRGTQGADVMVLRRVKNGELIMEGHIELF